MRKVDVVRPPINYVVSTYVSGQIAWFVDEGDAHDFVNSQIETEKYEIAEVRK